MAKVLIGDVEIKRIVELLTKVLSSSDLVNYHIAIDSTGDEDTKEVSLAALQTILLSSFDSGIYRPAVEPAISTGTLTVDCNGRSEVMVEPRLSVGTRTINTNYTLVHSNAGDTNLISHVNSFTGTITITMPLDVKCSNPSLIGTWTPGSPSTLELTAGTADIIEFQFLWDRSEAVWLLKVAEEAL